VLAEFASVVDAVRCAIENQSKIAAANDELPEARQMLFRIGINVGDVMVKNGDIFGDGVNVAARLHTLANAGGICLSRGAATASATSPASSSRTWVSRLSSTSRGPSGRFVSRSPARGACRGRRYRGRAKLLGEREGQRQRSTRMASSSPWPG
jgi:class 3 adenylate cyclase